ncbi:hypothetical protein [Jiangella rhizosphaerae]|uniref:Uncharacterized protein n=1 Tax=Jiangella rhizosphaerae TaxID=2293569 RepID=A0A418KHC8_9ACTN|nr:hypothetical protein [Jiangella rhizosphaerae]RIQ11657.1 hypothetical protein DY240_28275 [Jiangella rhizosphaerae]
MSDHDLETALRATLHDRAAAAPGGDDLADSVVRVGTARRRRRRLAGAVAVLAIGALAGLAGRGLVPVAGDAEPQPADTPPATELITCNPGWPAFDPAVLTERPLLDPNSDLGVAVRTTARPPIAARLIERWTLVDQVGSLAYLLIWLKDTPEAHNMAEGGLSTAIYSREADGTWTFYSGGGGCEPQRFFADGLNPVDWRLPGEQPPPEATSVTILASEIGCSSGQPADDRLAEPIVEYHEDAVDITLRVAPPEGEFFTCVGNPETTVTVQLDEPLGDRELRDGLWYPPRPATP